MTITYDMLETIIPNEKFQNEIAALKEYGIFQDGILVDFKEEVPNELIQSIIDEVYYESNGSIQLWYEFYYKVKGIEVNPFDFQNPKMNAYYAELMNIGSYQNAKALGQESTLNYKKDILTGKEEVAIGNVTSKYTYQICITPENNLKSTIKNKSIIIKMSFEKNENHIDFEVNDLGLEKFSIELTPMSAALYKLFCKPYRKLQLRSILDKEEIFKEFYDIYKFSEKVSDVKANTLLEKKDSSDTHYIGNRISDLNKELDNFNVHPSFKLNKGKDDYYYIPMFLSPKSKVTR